MPRQRKVDPEQLKTLEQRLAKAQRDLRYARTLEKKHELHPVSLDTHLSDERPER